MLVPAKAKTAKAAAIRTMMLLFMVLPFSIRTNGTGSLSHASLKGEIADRSWQDAERNSMSNASVKARHEGSGISRKLLEVPDRYWRYRLNQIVPGQKPIMA
jgi:hypothetical protein